MARPIVLDSTAVLAVLFNEPGAAQALDLLPGSLLSSVNLAEIHSRLVLSGHPPTPAWRRLLSLGFEVVPFSEEQARLAGELVSQSRAHPLSLADRACLALAIEKGATVYTTNRTWRSLPLEVEIEVIA